MANCVNCRFSIVLQLFSVNLKSAPVKHTPTYCYWVSHPAHSSCTYMSLWWENNSSLWLSRTVSIPKWVSILWHAACAPSDAKLLEGGVYTNTLKFSSKEHVELSTWYVFFLWTRSLFFWLKSGLLAINKAPCHRQHLDCLPTFVFWLSYEVIWGEITPFPACLSCVLKQQLAGNLITWN